MFRLQVIKKITNSNSGGIKPYYTSKNCEISPIILQVFSVWFSDIDSNQQIQEQTYKLKKGKRQRGETW